MSGLELRTTPIDGRQGIGMAKTFVLVIRHPHGALQWLTDRSKGS
jgi:hypothetical protein